MRASEVIAFSNGPPLTDAENAEKIHNRQPLKAGAGQPLPLQHL